MKIGVAKKTVSAWLLLSVGEERAFGGNDGYDDEMSSHYLWDSTVPNHACLAIGDTILLWDKKESLGLSTIQSIETTSGTKDLFRCYYCSASNIKKRKRLSPLYRCGVCKGEFDSPTVIGDVPVTEYRTEHASGWLPIPGFLDGAELRDLCESPRSQHSLRPLNWPKLTASLSRHGVGYDAGNLRWFKY